MSDAEFRVKAYRLLVTCGNNGDLGHCVGCGRFTAASESPPAHASGCQVKELLDAGPSEFPPAVPWDGDKP